MPYPSHWFDVMALGLVFSMVSAGFWRGFIGEIFPALALIAGFLAASLLNDKAVSLQSLAMAGLGREGTAYGGVFLAAWGVVSASGFAAKRYVFKSDKLTVADRVAGGALGLAKGGLLVAVIGAALGFIPSVKKDVAQKSVSGSTFISVGKFTMEKLAPGLAGRMDKKMKDLPLDKALDAMETKKAADKPGLGAMAKPSESSQEKGGGKSGR
jgi:uncharacterized membrane protein required for colicin V production